MRDFIIFNPTKIIFGWGVVENCGEEALKIGKKALIITGKNSTKKTGVLDKVINLLKEKGIESVVYAGVTPNPKTEEVDEAAGIGIKEKCDFVIGLGGGSAMDAAKGAAIVLKSAGNLWDYVALPNKKAKQIEDVAPIMLIPTLAATGSEGNPAAVFTNSQTQQKAAIYNPAKLYPKVSIVDPSLTVTVPPKQTAEGIIDIIMHVLEEYLTGDTDCDLQDRITEGIILTCIENAEKVILNPADVRARTNISLASTVALQGLPNAGRYGDWVVHPIEHAITGIYDNIAHGSGIAAVLPSYLRYLGEVKPDKVIQLAIRVFGADEYSDEQELPEVCVRGFEDFISSIGLANNLKDAGVKKEDLIKIADKLIEVSGIPGIIGNKDKLMKLLKDAYKE
jgi:alcohol dehydrogenase YqhD (iron-dependent ADH family)